MEADWEGHLSLICQIKTNLRFKNNEMQKQSRYK